MQLLIIQLLFIVVATLAIPTYEKSIKRNLLFRDEVREIVKEELAEITKNDKEDDKATEDLYSEFERHMKTSQQDAKKSEGTEVDDLKIQEGSSTVNEHIFLDKIKGIQIYHTDDHNGRKAVTEMIDSNYGYVATKLDRLVDNRCFIRKYDPSKDSNPSAVSRALKQTHNKMPKTIIERIDNFILKSFEGTLPEHIKKFCDGRTIVEKKVVNDLKEAENVINKELKDTKRSFHKRAILRDPNICSKTEKKSNCAYENLAVKCKFPNKSSCRYTVICPIMSDGNYDCKGVHSFNNMICCDDYCLN